eukprot:1638129-Pyramimonas_sp.AAC.1
MAHCAMCVLAFEFGHGGGWPLPAVKNSIFAVLSFFALILLPPPSPLASPSLSRRPRGLRGDGPIGPRPEPVAPDGGPSEGVGRAGRSGQCG